MIFFLTCGHTTGLIDKLVKAPAPANLHAVLDVCPLHPPTTNFTKLFLSSLWSDLSMWGHFLIVLNLRNQNLRSVCINTHLNNALYFSSLWSVRTCFNHEQNLQLVINCNETIDDFDTFSRHRHSSFPLLRSLFLSN